MAWLQVNFAADRNPGHDSATKSDGRDVWRTSYLFAVGCSGVATRSRLLGTRDWYLDVASDLLRRGSASADGVDKCFELLFLCKFDPRLHVEAATTTNR